MTTDDELVAASEPEAARISGFSRRQLRYWCDIALVQPSTVRKISPRNVVRLYDLNGLLALLVIRELKARKVTTNRIHRIVEYLKAHDQYTQPLTEVRWAIRPGGELVFQHADGSWEDTAPAGQMILMETLYLEPIRASLFEAIGKRQHDKRGNVERRRGVVGNKPVVAGTRLPVAAVEEWIERGASVKRILEAFPQLTADDVRAIRAGASVA